MIYSYKIPCQKSRLGEIRKFLNGLLSERDISEVDINSLILAVDEMCANIIIHTHNCNPEESIELSVDIQSHGITFEIEEKGSGFDINEYQEPSLKDIIHRKKKGGLGLILVRRIMDEIKLVQDNNRNIYRLYKKL